MCIVRVYSVGDKMDPCGIIAPIIHFMEIFLVKKEVSVGEMAS